MKINLTPTGYPTTITHSFAWAHLIRTIALAALAIFSAPSFALSTSNSSLNDRNTSIMNATLEQPQLIEPLAPFPSPPSVDKAANAPSFWCSGDSFIARFCRVVKRYTPVFMLPSNDVRRQIAAGRLEEAQQLALATHDPFEQADLCSQILGAYLGTRQGDAALDFAHLIPDAAQKATALYQIVLSFIEAGDAKKAQETMFEIQDEALQSDAMYHIIQSHLASGHIQKAMNMAEQMPLRFEQAWAWFRIAEHFMREKNWAMAQKMIQKIPDRDLTMRNAVQEMWNQAYRNGEY